MFQRAQLQTQFVIFVLFGDVVVLRGGSAWTASLLQMLEVLGVSERAARSTLSRMRRKGWLRPERDGRHSRYALTARGRRILEEGGQRIFEPRKTEWSGEWFQVVYSLPEKKRKLRNDLRKRLSWLGFGRLAAGTWISPNDRSEDVESMLDDLSARQYVASFSNLHLVGGENRELVERCWDLRGLNQQYQRFIQRWEPEVDRCAHHAGGAGALTPAECFARRFWITHEYSPFPRLDPNLPPPLLPDGWLGDRAASLFQSYRSLLSARSDEFIAQVSERPGERRPEPAA